MAKKAVRIAHPRGELAGHDDWVSRKPAERPAEPVKRLTIDIPESLHTRIKLACVADKMKMVEAIRLLLEQRWPAAKEAA